MYYKSVFTSEELGQGDCSTPASGEFRKTGVHTHTITLRQGMSSNAACRRNLNISLAGAMGGYGAGMGGAYGGRGMGRGGSDYGGDGPSSYGGRGRRPEHDFVEGKLFLGGLDTQTTKETLVEYCTQW